MRKLFVAAATVAVFALLVSPAIAGNGKGGGNKTTAPSSIDICEVDGVAVNGCAAGQVSVASAPSPHLRGSMNFAAEPSRLAGWEYPMVAVWCCQDLNGDGIQEWPNDGGDLVYMELRHPEEDFILGGAVSIRLSNGGGAVQGRALRLRMEGRQGVHSRARGCRLLCGRLT